jgi:hypothetical protein
MAEVEFTIPSALVGYSNAKASKILVDGELTPERLARMHWDWNVRFLLEQEKIANEPVSEEQEKAITKAATETLTQKIPATKVEETKSEAPWDAAPKAAEEKPWQKTPKFENLF